MGVVSVLKFLKKLINYIKENHSVKFIFKAYPSPKKDAKVANYASLVANEAYLHVGPELFLACNKAIFHSARLIVDSQIRMLICS